MSNKQNKVTFYLREENKARYSNMIEHFEKQSPERQRKLTDIMNEVCMIVCELFVETTNTKNVSERLLQLKKIQPKDTKRLLDEMTFVKRQIDILMYLGIVNFQAGMDRANFNISDLQSIYTGDDPETRILMEKIVSLIQKDKIRGQTIKHSKKK